MIRLLAALPAVVLVACSSSGGDSPASSSSTPAPAVPSPDSAQKVDLLAGLHRLGLPIATDGEKLITSARNVCLNVQGGDGRASLAKYAAAEFGVKRPVGARIVRLVERSFCSSS